MDTIRGCAATANGRKYLQQLCKHWGHKFEVEQTETRGRVRFPSAVATLEAGAGALLVVIESDDPKSTEHVKEVVTRHLDRFAFREAPLPFEWNGEQGALTFARRAQVLAAEPSAHLVMTEDPRQTPSSWSK